MAHIARIREKMSEPARKPKYIKTVWGWAIPLSKQKEQGTGSRLFHKRLAIKTTIQFITIIILFEVAYILLNLLF